MFGNSGAELSFGASTVTKTVRGAGAVRAAGACAKQRAFRSRRARAPEVLAERFSCEEHSFTMERVYGAPPLEPEGVRAVLAFVDEELSAARLAPVEGGVLTAKLDAVLAACRQNAVAADVVDGLTVELQRLRAELMWGCVLPVGRCHGDLTFCNMLWSGESLWLFDFLEPFFDSPAHDVVKLRQDTQYGWIAQFDRSWAAHLPAADALVHGHMKAHAWYRMHYAALAKLNLLRTLPYVRDAALVAHVAACVRGVP